VIFILVPSPRFLRFLRAGMLVPALCPAGFGAGGLKTKPIPQYWLLTRKKLT
jgi:hypothetical protein